MLQRGHEQSGTRMNIDDDCQASWCCYTGGRPLLQQMLWQLIVAVPVAEKTGPSGSDFI